MGIKTSGLTWIWCLLAATLISVLAFLVSPALEELEYLFLDWHLRATEAPANDQKLILILGGDRSMIEFGNWPWPRETHASLLNNQLADAEVVAYDVFLVDKSTEEQDALLAQAISDHGKVVLGSAFRQDGVLLEPLEIFRENATTGYFNFYPDEDYVMRRYLMAQSNEQYGFVPSFLYSVLDVADQEPAITANNELLLAGDETPRKLNDDLSIFKLSVPDDAYSVYEFSDVAQDKVPASAFEDAIVFVGISATGATDNIHTAEGYSAGTRVLADLYYELSSRYLPVQVPAAVQIVLLTLLLTFCIGLAIFLPNRSNWLPPVLAIIMLVLTSHLLFRYGGIYLPAAISSIVIAVCGFLQLFYLRVMRESRQKQKMLMNMISCLVSAIDAKDPITAGHSERVAEISVLIAKKKGLGRKEVDDVHFAGLIHDIGKIGVRDSVLNKPGKLTSEEFEEMKAHPQKGMAIMEQAGLPSSILSGISDHHERLDGKGYPSGKTSDDLSLFAQIIKIADVYDALVSKRQYKESWPIEKVCDTLYSGRGTEFDAELIDLFLAEIAPPSWSAATSSAASSAPPTATPAATH